MSKVMYKSPLGTGFNALPLFNFFCKIGIPSLAIILVVLGEIISSIGTLKILPLRVEMKIGSQLMAYFRVIVCL